MKPLDVRSIRAWLPKAREFFFPESKSADDLATFYGTLAGYSLMHIEFILTEGTGEIDTNGVECFVGDVIMVQTTHRKKVTKEFAVIRFYEGCYNAVNDDGLDVDIASCLIDEHNFAVIVGNEYQRAKYV